jgi:hypothetical protein
MAVVERLGAEVLAPGPHPESHCALALPLASCRRKKEMNKHKGAMRIRIEEIEVSGAFS